MAGGLGVLQCLANPMGVAADTVEDSRNGMSILSVVLDATANEAADALSLSALLIPLAALVPLMHSPSSEGLEDMAGLQGGIKYVLVSVPHSHHTRTPSLHAIPHR